MPRRQLRSIMVQRRRGEAQRARVWVHANIRVTTLTADWLGVRNQAASLDYHSMMQSTKHHQIWFHTTKSAPCRLPNPQASSSQGLAAALCRCRFGGVRHKPGPLRHPRTHGAVAGRIAVRPYMPRGCLRALKVAQDSQPPLHAPCTLPHNQPLWQQQACTQNDSSQHHQRVHQPAVI